MRTTDNNRGNFVLEPGVNPKVNEDILFIANKTIKDLAEEDKLLIFPHSLNAEYKDLEAKDHVISLHPKSKGGYELHTGNVMGFIGRNNTQLTISSRFYPDNDDLFLHYMLHKVFAINVFNLDHSKDKDPIWDFLLYLFPYYLKQAINQGLFKEYQRRQYNDANVKGSIDVARHLRINNPFMGKIAYRTREHSYDNNITQLIRHAIEYIRVHKFGNGILFNDSDTQNAVNQIIYATPTYVKNGRLKIINQNLRPVNHPYFTEYSLLQKICLQILRNEGLTYGKEKDKVYGLMFDGAWLWEEYLNVILQGKGLQHPQNKDKKIKRFLFENNQGVIYPDFFKESNYSVVADAKYKHIEETNFSGEDEYGRKDLYQLISYMFRFKANVGHLLFPVSNIMEVEGKSECKGCYKNTYTLNKNGYPGSIIKLGLKIPKLPMDEGSFKAFSEAIKKSEDEFLIQI